MRRRMRRRRRRKTRRRNRRRRRRRRRRRIFGEQFKFSNSALCSILYLPLLRVPSVKKNSAPYS